VKGRRAQSLRSRLQGKHLIHNYDGSRVDPEKLAMERKLQAAQKAEEIRQQHGPVRVLVRDGKPVEA